jgi:hypothetical protein
MITESRVFAAADRLVKGDGTVEVGDRKIDEDELGHGGVPLGVAVAFRSLARHRTISYIMQVKS